ncbi:MAG: tetratricopeptide repeat protein [Thermoflexales bacterium]|nr:tetratricopeptide repeat protein [Thermoflexales bacterium]
MSLNLIPSLIHNQLEQQTYEGHFQAMTMLVDISGFTALTEMLMQHTVDGAEVLANALNRIFSPPVAQAYAHGGFISSFAGDAFTAIFPLNHNDTQADTVAQHALYTAFFIQEFFTQHGTLETRYGRFEMGAKIGLSRGTVAWNILRGKKRHTYCFRGPAITTCARTEEQAGTGDIIAAAAIWPAIQPYVQAQPLDLVPPHFRLISMTAPAHLGPVATCATPTTSPCHAPRALVPEAVLDLVASGVRAEFRQVAVAFISFEEPRTLADWSAFAITAMDMAADYGGYFNKLDFGDKGPVMLILFGAPVAHENDLERAANFLLALQSTCAQGASPRFRAGLTFGMVYAGLIGGAERAEFTAIGNVVNLASRLMESANWGHILVSETATTQPHLSTDHVGNFHYKGFTEAQPTYRLLSHKADAESFFDQPMVGRQAELAQLVAAAQPMFDDPGTFAGVAYVYGEAGIGKSHLVYELRQALSMYARSAQTKTPHGLIWFTGQTDQTLRQAFNPFIYFLKQYFNQTAATPAENTARFENRLARLIANLQTFKPGDAQAQRRIQAITRELIRTQSLLGALLGLHWPNSLYASLNTQLRYQNTLYAIRALLLAESVFHPVVLVIEDLQWLDSASHEALTLLTHGVGPYPLFVILVSRYADDGNAPQLAPTYNVGLPDTIPVTRIDLNVLNSDDLAHLAEAILGGPADAHLLALLQARTQANPLFAQQFLYYFQEKDLLVWQPDTSVWLPKPNIPDDVPSTINAILIARVDRLEPSVKNVVKSAAVLGREFDTRILARMLESDILPEVQAAAQAQIWSEVTYLMRYLFKHILMRDAVYDMQLHRHLCELHRRAAEAIETMYTGNDALLKPHYADLAYHYEKAELEAQTIEYLHKAGDYAGETYDAQQAIAYYQKSLALLPADAANLPRQLSLHEGLSRMLRVQGNYPEAMVKARAMLAAAEALDDQAARARAWTEISWAQNAQGHNRAALESAGKAAGIALQANAQIELTSALILEGWARCRLGDLEEALALGNQALEISTTLPEERKTASAFNLLSTAYDALGQYEPAVYFTRQALAIYRKLGHRLEEGVMLNNLGTTVGAFGDYAAAVPIFQDALIIAREIGDRYSEMLCLSNLGGMQAATHDYQAAEQNLHQAIHIAEDINVQFPEAFSFLAQVYLGQKKLADAEAAARQALTLAQQSHEDIGGAWRALGWVAAQLTAPLIINEQSYTSADCFAEALRIFTEMGAEGERARTLRAWAKYELAQGERERGAALWQEARAIFEQLEMTLEVKRMTLEVKRMKQN